jgi:NADPH:quinone reductase-like Zn-dependent oxidoreductase
VAALAYVYFLFRVSSIKSSLVAEEGEIPKTQWAIVCNAPGKLQLK